MRKVHSLREEVARESRKAPSLHVLREILYAVARYEEPDEALHHVLNSPNIMCYIGEKELRKCLTNIVRAGVRAPSCEVPVKVRRYMAHWALTLAT